MSAPPTPAHRRHFAFLLANHPSLNYRRSEYMWYGPWDLELHLFRTIPMCTVFPQFPVWLQEPDDNISPDREDSLPSSSPSQSSSIMAVDSRPRSSRSLAASPSSAIHAAIDSLQQRDTKWRHRRPDFAILYLAPKRSSTDGSWRFKDYVVPVLVEIKPYHRFIGTNSQGDLVYGDDNHEGSVINRRQALSEAQEDVMVQTEYLFSGRVQATIIMIAAAGQFWTWRQSYKKNVSEVYADSDDDDFRPSEDVIIHRPDLVWSSMYTATTIESDAMLDKIRTWTGNLVLRNIVEDLHE